MTYPDGLRISEMTYAPGARLVIWISPLLSVINTPFWVSVTVANDAVQSHLAACRRSHPELGAGKGLARGAVPLLDDELALGLVLKGQADGAALFDLHRLGSGYR